jgi:hypothetical protein
MSMPFRPFRAVRRRLALIFSWVLPGVLAVAAMAGGPPPAARAAAVPTAAPAAMAVAVSYEMYFYNETYSTPSDGSLTSMSVDSSGDLTGFMTVNPPLFGTGGLTGTVSDGKIHFTVSGGDYTGTVNAATLDLSGTYTYPGQTGQWHATPANQCAISGTGCSTTLAITSPPQGSMLALTDSKYVQPQAKSGQRAPVTRHLIVAGTAQCAGPVTVNGVSVKVSSGTWTADVPVGDPGPMVINAQAAGCGQAASSITLISLSITSPKENQALSVTTTPSIPELNATVAIGGYQSDPSAVPFSWSLTMYGNYVTRKHAGSGSVPDWDNPYEEPIAAGSTTGVSQPWKPDYTRIVGGIGLLQVKATIPGVLDNPVRSDSRWLEITGNGTSLKSLSEAYTARNMKTHRDATTMDKILGCAESGWQQFARGSAGGAQTVTAVTGTPADMPGLSTAWWPKFGVPAGIGIAQVDPAGRASWPYRTSPYEYGDWDWKTNMVSGMRLYYQNLATAEHWRTSEQARLSSRLSALIAQAKKNRAGHPGAPFPALASVPQMTESQLLQDTIRLYNGGHQFYFDYDYVLSDHGLNVAPVGSRLWKTNGTYGGTWGKPASPAQRSPWHLIETKGAADYVTKVWNCQS